MSSRYLTLPPPSKPNKIQITRKPNRQFTFDDGFQVAENGGDGDAVLVVGADVVGQRGPHSGNDGIRS